MNTHAVIQKLITPAFSVQKYEGPEFTLQLITGEGNEVARAGGIFTQEDMINIKLYVKDGLALPINKTEVADFLGYKEIGIDGLEPENFRLLFNEIRQHSLSWDPVETGLQRQSFDLNKIAKNIVGTGNDILKYISAMPIEKRRRTLGEVSDQKLAEITYTNEDKELAADVRDILNSMKTDIINQKNKSIDLKNKIDDFRIMLIGGELSNGIMLRGLEPQISLKSNLMKKNNLQNAEKKLQDQIDVKKEEIAQLKKDYSQYVKYSFTGAAIGPLALIITGSIFGSKAEAARKKKTC